MCRPVDELRKDLDLRLGECHIPQELGGPPRREEEDGGGEAKDARSTGWKPSVSDNSHFFGHQVRIFIIKIRQSTMNLAKICLEQ